MERRAADGGGGAKNVVCILPERRKTVKFLCYEYRQTYQWQQAELGVPPIFRRCDEGYLLGRETPRPRAAEDGEGGDRPRAGGCVQEAQHRERPSDSTRGAGV